MYFLLRKWNKRIFLINRFCSKLLCFESNSPPTQALQSNLMGEWFVSDKIGLWDSPDVKYVTTAKGVTFLSVNGFLYTRHSANNILDRVYWRCRKRSARWVSFSNDSDHSTEFVFHSFQVPCTRSDKTRWIFYFLLVTTQSPKTSLRDFLIYRINSRISKKLLFDRNCYKMNKSENYLRFREIKNEK